MFDLRDLSGDTGVLVDAFVRTVDDAPVSPAQDGAQQLRHFSSEKGRPLAMSWGRAGGEEGNLPALQVQAHYPYLSDVQTLT